MGKQMKVIAVLVFVCFLVPFVYAKNNETEVLTFSTYYPSPTGNYRSLKLDPSSEPTIGVEEGVLYYDGSQNVLRYLNGTNSWVNVTGSDTGGGGSGGSGDESWTVLTRTCPWGSAGGPGTANSGWGDQCGADGSGCCVPPSCPSGWTEVGIEVTLESIACPKTGSGRGCEYHESDETWYHPVAVGNVVRKCVKKGALVVKFSRPWASDYRTRKDPPNRMGWGDQCFSPWVYCNTTFVFPCLPSWTTIGMDVEVKSVSCPKTKDENYADPYTGGCFWDSQLNTTHPVAAGNIVRICEKE